jgi:phage shock protein A
MAELTLISDRERPLKPLIEAALANELRLVEAGIRRTEGRLREFEQKHHMVTAEFVSRYENDEFQETLEFAEWIGEYRLLMRLRDKAETLREIRFAS